MARLRYNGLTATLGADLLTAGTTITFTAALTSAAGAVPTITGTDYIPLAILDTGGGVVEIVHLTAYTSGAMTGTVTRGQESTAATDHTTGATAVNGPTILDVGATQTFAFTKAGTVATATGASRLYVEQAAVIQSVRASVGTAPTGAALIVDVNKNGATIFTTQSKRPQIAVSTNTDLSDTPDVTTLAAGDYLTVDVDQVGSTVAGSDLVVTIVTAKA